jgi:hypothetical protein
VENNLEYLLEFLHGSAERLERQTVRLERALLGSTEDGSPEEVTQLMAEVAEIIELTRRIHGLIAERIAGPESRLPLGTASVVDSAALCQPPS